LAKIPFELCEKLIGVFVNPFHASVTSAAVPRVTSFLAFAEPFHKEWGKGTGCQVAAKHFANWINLSLKKSFEVQPNYSNGADMARKFLA
jgi:hypothetical protein